MTKKEKAKLIGKILDKYFPDPAVPLKHDDAYTLLVAVVLSARNTDAKVNKITPELFAKASTPKDMVKLSIDEIKTIIRPCGLSPTKAKALWHLSKILDEKYKGKVPQSFHALEELPGVGHKTASVVMAQAFHHPAFPVDTHIHRCAKRWGLSSGKNVELTERDLKRVFPSKKWIKVHLQIIYFARQYCSARSHDAAKCPICSILTKSKKVVKVRSKRRKRSSK
jgi:endonuclease-3